MALCLKKDLQVPYGSAAETMAATGSAVISVSSDMAIFANAS